MSNINIQQVSYPKTGSTNTLAINAFELNTVTIDLKDEIITDVNNINFEVVFQYIDYAIPGNIFAPTRASLTFTNDTVP